MGYQKVLVPVSGKFRLERAGRALEHALQIVREDGEICFIHCADDGTHLITGEPHKQLVMQDAHEAEKLIRPLAERTKNAGIAYNLRIIEGSPMTHIPKFAAENKFDVVVMCTGSHLEPNDPGDHVIGSVTERVYKYLNVPLFIVH
jgi:nucleotide-binding universal stress UspA family protein